VDLSFLCSTSLQGAHRDKIYIPPHIKYTNQQDHNSGKLNAILLRPDVFRNSEFFGFWEGNTAYIWGLGQHPIIKHITISAAKCVNIHIKWDI